MSVDAGFDELRSHPIVRVFVNRRLHKVDDTKRVAPLPSGHEVYRLALQHDHRGATWYDEENDVVWLCAYRLHRSGAASDAFPYFKELDAADRLLPTAEDYAALVEDRDARLVDTVVADAQKLLTRARRSGGEVRGTLGGGGTETEVGVAVEVIATLEETSVAFVASAINKEWATVILAAFFPDVPFDQLETPDNIAGRELDEGEICYRHLSG